MYKIKHYVDRHRTLIEDAFQYIWTHPETGYREWQTTPILRSSSGSSAMS